MPLHSLSTFLVCYTPHTTSIDAEFVGKNLVAFEPDVYIREDPDRSPEGIEKLEARYRKIIAGEEVLDEKQPNYSFHKRMYEFLREYILQRPINMYFLELHPKETVTKLQQTHTAQLDHNRSAWKFFDGGQLEEACGELYQALKLNADIGKIRAQNIQGNSENLVEKLQERFSHLRGGKRIKAFAWISGQYAPPIIDFNRCAPIVEERYQKTPYPYLSHVEAVRKMILGNDIDAITLALSFIENILEKALRDVSPDSAERFAESINLVSGLDYNAIKSLSKKVSQGLTYKEVAQLCLKKQ